jgi:hypothetical protein
LRFLVAIPFALMLRRDCASPVMGGSRGTRLPFPILAMI